MIRSSTTLILVMLVVAGIGYGAWNLLAETQVNRIPWKTIPPGRINLVAVAKESGYRIVVSNDIAHLTQGGGSFGAADDRSEDSNLGTDKKRLPIREMLGSLQGNPNDLSVFISRLNDFKEEDLPPVQVVWTAENLEKVFEGDPKLKTDLEHDLNCQLDGTPLEEIRPSALENGIVLDYPVSITINEGDEQRKVEARIKEAYTPTFCNRVHDHYKTQPSITSGTIRGFYLEEAQRITSGVVQKEDIEQAIKARISSADQLAKVPEELLKHVEVVVTDAHILNASTNEEVDAAGKPQYTLSIKVNEEGRLRLWKYSRQHPGFQLLLIVDGVAVAAPRIDGELAANDVRINRLGNKQIALQTAEKINSESSKGK